MTIEQEIYNVAIENGFTPVSAKFVVAQAKLESSNFGSNVFKNNNNMFGMKYVGQSLASRGTLAPSSERRCGGNCDSDYYAKYKTPSDSAKDAIQRLYSKTMYGVTPQQLKDSTTAEEFALNLKKRHYYGFQVDPSKWGAEVANYAKNLIYRLKSVTVSEVFQKAKENKGKILILGLGLIAISSYLYFKKK